MRKLVLPLWIGLMAVPPAIYANAGSQSGRVHHTLRYVRRQDDRPHGGGDPVVLDPHRHRHGPGRVHGGVRRLVNLFTGWTGIGWFVALFFSFLGKRQD